MKLHVEFHARRPEFLPSYTKRYKQELKPYNQPHSTGKLHLPRMRPLVAKYFV